ncbi:multidrug effflux MFS transporter [Bradyrhizobium sp. LHD-71]|uniref:multidrug effflux MFS transporter n=1 Tax=Bradyrhizobium sp. LHD-71 TaxID=3072141 RepID=UPI00280F4D40|nr:multidrug effflux MFS transporter [Bradyrhizobium sp. LHD-71]MDQ8726541.1 multidrug effflux MFS transporter [Bradyrhizobium sp. LHD-71]
MNSLPPTEAADYVSPRHQPMSFAEFVILIAGLMALTALATSMMLAVLAEIGKTFSVDVTITQSVLTAFFVGFSVGQFVVGPVSDRFGRRPVLLGGLALYLAASVLCVIAPSLETLLVARFVQGLGAAAPRVITISIVRDCYSGRRMASVMSLAMTILMVIPVIAPTLGQIVVLAAPWRWIFVFLTLYGIVAIAWMYLRLPETLAPENKRTLQPMAIMDAVWQALTTRRTLGYMLATGVTQGLLLATLYAAPQVMGELLGMGHYFTVAFGIAAAAMSLGQFVNSRLVGHLGMRLLSHGQIVLGTLLCVALFLLARAEAIGPIAFTVFMCAVNPLFMAASSNFNALAMEPQGRIAGTASSLFGSVTTMMQASIAHMIGQAYDGTLLPLTAGMAVCGLVVIAIAAITERGKLFDSRAPK